MSTKQSNPLLQSALPQTEAILNLQKELLEVYAQANRDWLDRVKSEVELWSELAAKLATIRSVPEMIEVYRRCAATQFQMFGEDAQRLVDNCQKTAQRIAGSLNGNRWPTGSA